MKYEYHYIIKQNLKFGQQAYWNFINKKVGNRKNVAFEKLTRMSHGASQID